MKRAASTLLELVVVIAKCAPLVSVATLAAATAVGSDLGQVPERRANDAEVQPAAFAQLGSARFRHAGPVFDAAFAPDGKTVATAALGSISVWGTANGKLLCRVHQTQAPCHRVAFSSDGKTLYAVLGPTQEGCELVTFDPTTGRERSRLGIAKVVYRGAEFNHDASRLAVFSMQEPLVVLVDPAAGKELARVPAPWRGNSFTADGKRLLLADSNEIIRILDATSGRETGKLTPGNRRPPWVRLTRDGVVLLGGQNSVERWDPQRNLSLWQETWLPAGEGLEVSPDGKWAAHVSSYAVTVMNIETGKRHFRARKDTYTSARFGPKGMLALTSSSGVLALWSTVTAESLPQSPELSGLVSGLTFSRDSRTLMAAAADHYDHQWVSWDLTPAVPEPGPKAMAQFTMLAPGGRTGLRPDSFNRADGPAEFVDAHSGKRISRFDPPETPDTVIISRADYRKGLFSGDGRRFVGRRRTARSPGGQQTDLGLAVWDVITGKRIADLPDKKDMALAVAVSPDGKAVAILSAPTPGKRMQLAVWQPDTGRILWTRESAWGFVSFTRGGSWLVVQAVYPAAPPGVLRTLPPPGPHPFFILDAATGKEILKAAGSVLGEQPLVPADGTYHSIPAARAVAPDGRTVAVSGFDGTIYLWDLLADAERYRFSHPGPVHDLAFSPDGRTLAAASRAAPIVVYDVYGIRGRTGHAPDAASLARAWDDLQSPKAATGFRAVRLFIAAGPEGSRVLRERMRTVRFPPREQIEAWIAELGSDLFKTRERAMTELKKISRRAQSRLQAALQKPASLEVARRIQQVLSAADKPDAEELRAARAVEALQMSDSPQAAKVLSEWATSDDELLRREANSRWRE